MDQIPAAMDRHLDVIQCRKGKIFLFLNEISTIFHVSLNNHAEFTLSICRLFMIGIY